MVVRFDLYSSGWSDTPQNVYVRARDSGPTAQTQAPSVVISTVSPLPTPTVFYAKGDRDVVTTRVTTTDAGSFPGALPAGAQIVRTQVSRDNGASYGLHRIDVPKALLTSRGFSITDPSVVTVSLVRSYHNPTHEVRVLCGDPTTDDASVSCGPSIAAMQFWNGTAWSAAVTGVGDAYALPGGTTSMVRLCAQADCGGSATLTLVTGTTAACGAGAASTCTWSNTDGGWIDTTATLARTATTTIGTQYGEGTESATPVSLPRIISTAITAPAANALFGYDVGYVLAVGSPDYQVWVRDQAAGSWMQLNQRQTCHPITPAGTLTLDVLPDLATTCSSGVEGTLGTQLVYSFTPGHSYDVGVHLFSNGTQVYPNGNHATETFWKSAPTVDTQSWMYLPTLTSLTAKGQDDVVAMRPGTMSVGGNFPGPLPITAQVLRLSYSDDNGATWGLHRIDVPASVTGGVLGAVGGTRPGMSIVRRYVSSTNSNILQLLCGDMEAAMTPCAGIDTVQYWETVGSQFQDLGWNASAGGYNLPTAAVEQLRIIDGVSSFIVSTRTVGDVAGPTWTIAGKGSVTPSASLTRKVRATVGTLTLEGVASSLFTLPRVVTFGTVATDGSGNVEFTTPLSVANLSGSAKIHLYEQSSGWKRVNPQLVCYSSSAIAVLTTSGTTTNSDCPATGGPWSKTGESVEPLTDLQSFAAGSTYVFSLHLGDGGFFPAAKETTDTFWAKAYVSWTKPNPRHVYVSTDANGTVNVTAPITVTVPAGSTDYDVDVTGYSSASFTAVPAANYVIDQVTKTSGSGTLAWTAGSNSFSLTGISNSSNHLSITFKPLRTLTVHAVGFTGSVAAESGYPALSPTTLSATTSGADATVLVPNGAAYAVRVATTSGYVLDSAVMSPVGCQSMPTAAPVAQPSSNPTPTTASSTVVGISALDRDCTLTLTFKHPVKLIVSGSGSVDLRSNVTTPAPVGVTLPVSIPAGEERIYDVPAAGWTANLQAAGTYQIESITRTSGIGSCTLGAVTGLPTTAEKSIVLNPIGGPSANCEVTIVIGPAPKAVTLKVLGLTTTAGTATLRGTPVTAAYPTAGQTSIPAFNGDTVTVAAAAGYAVTDLVTGSTCTDLTPQQTLPMGDGVSKTVVINTIPPAGCILQVTLGPKLTVSATGGSATDSVATTVTRGDSEQTAVTILGNGAAQSMFSDPVTAVDPPTDYTPLPRLLATPGTGRWIKQVTGCAVAETLSLPSTSALTFHVANPAGTFTTACSPTVTFEPYTQVKVLAEGPSGESIQVQPPSGSYGDIVSGAYQTYSTAASTWTFNVQSKVPASTNLISATVTSGTCTIASVTGTVPGPGPAAVSVTTLPAFGSPCDVTVKYGPKITLEVEGPTGEGLSAGGTNSPANSTYQQGTGGRDLPSVAAGPGPSSFGTTTFVPNTGSTASIPLIYDHERFDPVPSGTCTEAPTISGDGNKLNVPAMAAACTVHVNFVPVVRTIRVYATGPSGEKIDVNPSGAGYASVTAPNYGEYTTTAGSSWYFVTRPFDATRTSLLGITVTGGGCTIGSTVPSSPTYPDLATTPTPIRVNLVSLPRPTATCDVTVKFGPKVKLEVEGPAGQGLSIGGTTGSTGDYLQNGNPITISPAVGAAPGPGVGTTTVVVDSGTAGHVELNYDSNLYDVGLATGGGRCGGTISGGELRVSAFGGPCTERVIYTPVIRRVQVEAIGPSGQSITVHYGAPAPGGTDVVVSGGTTSAPVDLPAADTWTFDVKPTSGTATNLLGIAGKASEACTTDDHNQNYPTGGTVPAVGVASIPRQPAVCTVQVTFAPLVKLEVEGPAGMGLSAGGSAAYKQLGVDKNISPEIDAAPGPGFGTTTFVADVGSTPVFHLTYDAQDYTVSTTGSTCPSPTLDVGSTHASFGPLTGPCTAHVKFTHVPTYVLTLRALSLNGGQGQLTSTPATSTTPVVAATNPGATSAVTVNQGTQPTVLVEVPVGYQLSALSTESGDSTYCPYSLTPTFSLPLQAPSLAATGTLTLSGSIAANCELKATFEPITRTVRVHVTGPSNEEVETQKLGDASWTATLGGGAEVNYTTLTDALPLLVRAKDGARSNLVGISVTSCSIDSTVPDPVTYPTAGPVRLNLTGIQLNTPCDVVVTFGAKLTLSVVGDPGVGSASVATVQNGTPQNSGSVATGSSAVAWADGNSSATFTVTNDDPANYDATISGNPCSVPALSGATSTLASINAPCVATVTFTPKPHDVKVEALGPTTKAVTVTALSPVVADDVYGDTAGGANVHTYTVNAFTWDFDVRVKDATNTNLLGYQIKAGSSCQTDTVDTNGDPVVVTFPTPGPIHLRATSLDARPGSCWIQVAFGPKVTMDVLGPPGSGSATLSYPVNTVGTTSSAISPVGTFSTFVDSGGVVTVTPTPTDGFGATVVGSPCTVTSDQATISAPCTLTVTFAPLTVTNLDPAGASITDVYPGDSFTVDTVAQKTGGTFDSATLLLNQEAASLSGDDTGVAVHVGYDAGTSSWRKGASLTGLTTDLVSPVTATVGAAAPVRVYLDAVTVCFDAARTGGACTPTVMGDATKTTPTGSASTGSVMHVRWRVRTFGDWSANEAAGGNVRLNVVAKSGVATVQSNAALAVAAPSTGVRYNPKPLPTVVQLSARGENDTVTTDFRVAPTDAPDRTRFTRVLVSQDAGSSWAVHRVELPASALPSAFLTPFGISTADRVTLTRQAAGVRLSCGASGSLAPCGAVPANAGLWGMTAGGAMVALTNGNDGTFTFTDGSAYVGFSVSYDTDPSHGVLVTLADLGFPGAPAPTWSSLTSDGVIDPAQASQRQVKVALGGATSRGVESAPVTLPQISPAASLGIAGTEEAPLGNAAQQAVLVHVPVDASTVGNDIGANAALRFYAIKADGAWAPAAGESWFALAASGSVSAVPVGAPTAAEVYTAGITRSASAQNYLLSTHLGSGAFFPGASETSEGFWNAPTLRWKVCPAGKQHPITPAYDPTLCVNVMRTMTLNLNGASASGATADVAGRRPSGPGWVDETGDDPVRLSDLTGPRGILTGAHPTETMDVPDGLDWYFRVDPDADFEVQTVTVDGAPVSYVATDTATQTPVYRMTNVVTPHTVSITLQRKPRVLTLTYTEPGAEAGWGGSAVVTTNVAGDPTTPMVTTPALSRVQKTSVMRIDYGDNWYFSVAPAGSNAADFEVVSVKDGATDLVKASGLYGIASVTADRTITILQRRIPRTVTLTAVGPAGSGSLSVTQGATTTTDQAEPLPDQNVSSVQVDSGISGTQVTYTVPTGHRVVSAATGSGFCSATGLPAPGSIVSGTITLGTVSAPCEVRVTFERYWTITPQVVDAAGTPTASGNGSITPATPQQVADGSSKTFAIAANADFEVAWAQDCDGAGAGCADITPTPTTSYTYSSVTASRTLKVHFRRIPRTVSVQVVPAAGSTPTSGATLTWNSATVGNSWSTSPLTIAVNATGAASGSETSWQFAVAATDADDEVTRVEVWSGAPSTDLTLSSGTYTLANIVDASPRTIRVTVKPRPRGVTLQVSGASGETNARANFTWMPVSDWTPDSGVYTGTGASNNPLVVLPNDAGVHLASTTSQTWAFGVAPYDSSFEVVSVKDGGTDVCTSPFTTCSLAVPASSAKTVVVTVQRRQLQLTLHAKQTAGIGGGTARTTLTVPTPYTTPPLTAGTVTATAPGGVGAPDTISATILSGKTAPTFTITPAPGSKITDVRIWDAGGVLAALPVPTNRKDPMTWAPTDAQGDPLFLTADSTLEATFDALPKVVVMTDANVALSPSWAKKLCLGDTRNRISKCGGTSFGQVKVKVTFDKPMRTATDQGALLSPTLTIPGLPGYGDSVLVLQSSPTPSWSGSSFSGTYLVPGGFQPDRALCTPTGTATDKVSACTVVVSGLDGAEGEIIDAQGLKDRFTAYVDSTLPALLPAVLTGPGRNPTITIDGTGTTATVVVGLTESMSGAATDNDQVGISCASGPCPLTLVGATLSSPAASTPTLSLTFTTLTPSVFTSGTAVDLRIEPTMGTANWVDVGGNQLARVPRYTFQFADSTPPSLSLVGVTRGGQPVRFVKWGDTLTVRVRASEALRLSPAPQVTLMSGGSPFSNTATLTPGDQLTYSADIVVSGTGSSYFSANIVAANVHDEDGNGAGAGGTVTFSAPLIHVDNELPNPGAASDPSHWDTTKDNGTRAVLVVTDQSTDDSGVVSVQVDLAGKCAPDPSSTRVIRGGSPISVRIVDVVSVQPANTDASACGSTLPPGYVRLWFRASDESGNYATGTSGAWFSRDMRANTSSAVNVTYHFSPASPLPHAGPGSSCPPGLPESSGRYCEAQVLIDSVSFADGAGTSGQRIYLHRMTAGQDVSDLVDPVTSPSGWFQLIPLSTASGATFRSSMTDWPGAAEEYAEYAVGFQVDHPVANSTPTAVGRVGSTLLVLDSRDPGTADLLTVNGTAGQGLTPIVVQEPAGNITPRFDGRLQNPGTGTVTIRIHPTKVFTDALGSTTLVADSAQTVGTLGPIVASGQSFNATYVIRLGSAVLSGCSEQQVAGANPTVLRPCTYVADATVRNNRGLESSTGVPITFTIQTVRGYGSFDASNDAAPIAADGLEHYDLALAVRDQYGNRIPDASVGCFTRATDGTWSVERDRADCAASSHDALLPDTTSGSVVPANIDLVQDNDRFDTSAVVVGRTVGGFTPSLANRSGDGAGTFDAQLYALAPSVDTRRYVPGLDGAPVLNPHFGRDVPVDLDLRFAVGVGCEDPTRTYPNCITAGVRADGTTPDPTDYINDHGYLRQRTPTGLRAQLTTAVPADPRAVFFQDDLTPATDLATGMTKTFGYVQVRGSSAADEEGVIVYAPALAKAVWSGSSAPNPFRDAMEPQIPTARVSPLIESRIRQVASTGADNLVGLGPINTNGGFERLYQETPGDASSTMPVGYTLSGGAATVHSPVHGGASAVSLPTGASLTGKMPIQQGSAYDVTVRARLPQGGTAVVNPLAGSAVLLEADGTPLPVAVAWDPLNAQVTDGDWVLLRGTLPATVDELQGTLFPLELTAASDDVLIDTLSVTPKLAGETASTTSLILGTATNWQVDLVNRGGSEVSVDPLASLAALSFRYGTAVWGNFSDVQLSLCHQALDPAHPDPSEAGEQCTAPLSVSSAYLDPGTQDVQLQICEQSLCITPSGQPAPTTPLPATFRLVPPGNWLRLTFTATAGITTSRVATTQGLAETQVRFPVSASPLAQFAAAVLPPMDATGGWIPEVRYLSNALALDIFNPIGAVADQPTPSQVVRFTPAELAGIRNDLRREVTIATRVKEVSATGTCPGVDDSDDTYSRDAACIERLVQQRKTFVVQGDLSTNLTPSGLTAKVLVASAPTNTLATVPDPFAGVVEASPTFPASRSLPVYREGEVSLVPGNAILAPAPGQRSICLPPGDHALVVRGNLVLLGDLRNTLPGDATCPGPTATRSFGIVVLPLPTQGVDVSVIGDSSSLPGGVVFIAPSVGLVQASIYSESALLSLQPDQPLDNLLTVSTLNEALSGAAGPRIVPNDATRAELLKDQLLLMDGHVISMLNTWGGSSNEQPLARTVDERVALDLSVHRVFQLDEQGVPLRDGRAAPLISTLPDYRRDPVVIAPRPLATLPPLFSRVGAFSAQEVAKPN